MKQTNKPSFVSPKKKVGDGYSTHFETCISNSCSLPENTNETDRLASDITAEIFSYLALLHAEIARFTQAIFSKKISPVSSL